MYVIPGDAQGADKAVLTPWLYPNCPKAVVKTKINIYLTL